MTSLTMKFYVDNTGKYLGGWDASPPSGGIEVPVAPMDAKQVWDFGLSSWSAVTQGVPSRVTMRQARLALHAAGLLQSVEAAINAMPEPPQTAARIEWDYASEVHRASEFVGMLGTAIGLDEQGLDDLFLAAAAI